MKTNVWSFIKQIAESDPTGNMLLETSVATTNPNLYNEAIELYGSWEEALVAVIVQQFQPKQSRSSKPKVEENIVRIRTPQADDFLLGRTKNGHFFRLDSDDLPITENPVRFRTADGAGPIFRIDHIGEPEGVFLFTNEGRYYGMIGAVLPTWNHDEKLRSYHNMLSHMFSTEHVFAALPRRAGQMGRFIHATKDGKGKASEASEIGALLDQSGREAFLVKGEDEPVAIVTGPDTKTIFCASAMGQGIHFEQSDIRSMGRKSVGVNLMKLSGPTDEIVNMFFGDGVAQLAVVTERGLGKRISFEDFRTQGRGGSGMQVLKLEPGDRVICVVPLLPSEDLVIFTDHNRVHRMEASRFPLMGRPAKGNQVVSLKAGELVIGLSVAPCSTSDP